jgi:hypothetical protein
MRFDYIGHTRSALAAARDLFAATGATPDWAVFVDERYSTGPVNFRDVASTVFMSVHGEAPAVWGFAMYLALVGNLLADRLCGRPATPVEGELPALRDVSLADAELAVRSGQLGQATDSNISDPTFEARLFGAIKFCLADQGPLLEDRSPGSALRYLEQSHVAHVIRFGDLLRVEFLVLTAWLKSAEWARQYRSLYEVLPVGDRWQTVRQAIEEADRRSLSPLRFLSESYPDNFAPAQVAYDSDIEWFDYGSPAAGLEHTWDIVASMDADEARYETVLLTPQQEDVVNASLRDVFLGK